MSEDLANELIDLPDAVESGDAAKVAKCLERGESPNTTNLEEGEIQRTRTPVLYTACEKKFAPIVAALLKGGADPNAYYHRHSIIDSESIPCLIAAIPSLEIVEMLLKAGADPNVGHFQREDTGWTLYPLYFASGNQELIDLLRRYGASDAKPY